MAKKIVKKKARAKRGSRYSCSICGLIVTVDNICGCVETCDIVCCGEEMKPKR